MRNVVIDWSEAAKPSRFTRLESGWKEFDCDRWQLFLPGGIEPVNDDKILSESIAFVGRIPKRDVAGFRPFQRDMFADLRSKLIPVNGVTYAE